MEHGSTHAGGSSPGGLAPHRGVLILTLGILGIIICAPLGIPAYLMGKNDLAAIRAGRMDPSGLGLTQAGHVLGIIGLAFLLIGLLAAVVGVIIAAIAGTVAVTR